MLEQQIQNLTEKVDQLTQLVYELSKMTTPIEQSSVSNRHVLTDIQGACVLLVRQSPPSMPMPVKVSSPTTKEEINSTSMRMNYTNGLREGNKTAMASIPKRC